MDEKYYVVIAIDAGGFGQSDDLFLLSQPDGRIIGYSDEFEVGTYDIADACRPDRYYLAKWQRITDDIRFVPAGFDEITTLGLEKYVIGWKRSMGFESPLNPIQAG
jgi:hypothetical protein